jgi:glycosyltransferase involved in cell wall biosynthesis
MKLLFCVEFYYPSMGGMQEVTKRLAEGFVRNGHEVTVATTHLEERTSLLLNGVNIRGFKVSGKQATGIKGDIKAYSDFLLNEKIDVIVLFAAQQWTVDVALPLLDQIKAKKIFVPTGFSGLFDPDFKKYYVQMPTWLSKMDGTVFLSAHYRDFEFSQKHVRNYKLIPNGASKEEFENVNYGNFRGKYGISSDTRILVHVGSHTGCKGHDETIKIFKKLKSKNVLLLIIGNYFHQVDEKPKLSLREKIKKIFYGQSHCPYSCKYEYEALNESWSLKLNNKKIMITELPRFETMEALKDSDLFVFLSNIECSPIVLYEAMASQCAIISTDVGNSMEILEKSGAGITTPTWINNLGFSYSKINTTAKIIDWLLTNSSQRETMAKQGHTYWQENATWEKIITDYETYFKEILDA